MPFVHSINDSVKPTWPEKIKDVRGKQILSTDKHQYIDSNWQYATTSYGDIHEMTPGLIVFAEDKHDIAVTLQYARTHGKRVAVRTGGHQYSGASSTNHENILLDLRKTFSREEPTLNKPANKGDKTTATMSVSWKLGDFNNWMRAAGIRVFVPTGQCAGVMVGGHVQTGGYGQLGRSFGLFGDHVISIDLVDPDNPQTWTKTVTKESDPDLFWAILGGSPGNFGIVTHITIEVHQEKDYPYNDGLWALHHYSQETLKKMVDKLVEFSDDDDLPRNLDLCISVVSEGIKPYGTFPDLLKRLKQASMDHEGIDAFLHWNFRAIVVYVQWVAFGQEDRMDNAKHAKYFEPFKSGYYFTRDTVDARENGKPFPGMSDLTSWWLFPHEREFDTPYIKRTYTTKSQTLGKDGWAKTVTEQIHKAIYPNNNGLYVSAQLQPFGGKNSQFRNNADNGTSYSYRDSTVVATLDAFHRPENKFDALIWQLNNDALFGQKGLFTDKDRRVLWGSYSQFEDPKDFIMDNVKDAYYDSPEKYRKLQELRAKYDPDDIYTPNTFCVSKPEKEDKGKEELGQPLIHIDDSWLPYHPARKQGEVEDTGGLGKTTVNGPAVAVTA